MVSRVNSREASPPPGYVAEAPGPAGPANAAPQGVPAPPQAPPRYEVRNGPLGALDHLRQRRVAAQGGEAAVQQAQLDSGLRRACEHGDEQAVAHYLQSGANPNALSPGGHAAVHTATRQANPRILEMLLDNPHAGGRGDPDLPSRSRRPYTRRERLETPAHLAMRHRNPGALQVLQQHGADLQRQDARHRTPQQLANDLQTRFLQRANFRQPVPAAMMQAATTLAAVPPAFIENNVVYAPVHPPAERAPDEVPPLIQGYTFSSSNSGGSSTQQTTLQIRAERPDIFSRRRGTQPTASVPEAPVATASLAAAVLREEQAQEEQAQGEVELLREGATQEEEEAPAEAVRQDPGPSAGTAEKSTYAPPPRRDDGPA